MNRTYYRKGMALFFQVIVITLATGTGLVLGLWFGQTGAGQWMPRLFAVGTIVSFAGALYVSMRQSRLATDMKCATRQLFVFISLSLCALVLASSITATATWQTSASDRVAGFVPYSDAGDYYRQVLNWPAENFDAWNSRRPLNSTLNILSFHLGGSTLLGFQLVKVAIAALAIGAFIIALGNIVGASAGMTVGFSLLIWSWPFASSMLSEINGITVSASSFALLFSALSRQRQMFAYLGLFGLVSACAYRPYNPLLPAIFAVAVALMHWCSWRRAWKHAAVMVALCTLLVLTMPQIIYLAYGAPSGSPNSNTGTVVLGLARGTNWEEANNLITSEHSGLSERDANGLMYRKAFEAILADPRPLLKALAKSGFKSISAAQQELGATFGFEKHLKGMEKKIDRHTLTQYVLEHPSIWITSLFFLTNIFFLFATSISQPIQALGLSSLIAFLSISPIVFTDGGWRAVATLYPGIALLNISMPLAMRQYFSNKATSQALDYPLDSSDAPQTNLTFTLPCLILLICAFASVYPLLSRWFVQSADRSSNTVRVFLTDEKRPAWIGFNTATINHDHLLDWAVAQRHLGIQAFLALHGKDVVSLDYEEGRIVFYVKNLDLSALSTSKIEDRLFLMRSAVLSDDHDVDSPHR